MVIQRYIPFRTDEHELLLDYAASNGIKFSRGEIISSLEISEDSIHWPWVEAYVHKHDIRTQPETKYTARELRSAQWLRVRSKWRNGYPQPEGAFAYEAITYNTDDNCLECGAGLVQQDAFRINKTPSWGNRHFMMLNWVEDELFVDETAKNILTQSGLSGLSFREVKDKKGVQYLDNVYQLQINTVLPEGYVADRRAVNAINVCPKCGTAKYHPTGIGMHAFKAEIFEGAPDLVKSAEVFGWGHSATRLILVSQKLFQVITHNKLERGLVFEPIELV